VIGRDSSGVPNLTTFELLRERREAGRVEMVLHHTDVL